MTDAGWHLHAPVVQWAVGKVVAGICEVQLQLQALHVPPVPLALDGRLRRDQVAIATC